MGCFVTVTLKTSSLIGKLETRAWPSRRAMYIRQQRCFNVSHTGVLIGHHVINTAASWTTWPVVCSFSLGRRWGRDDPRTSTFGWGQSRTVVCKYRCRTHVDPSGPLSRRTVRMIQWEGQAWHGHLSPGQAVSVKWPLSTWRIIRRHLLNGLALADELQNSWNWLAPVLCHGRGCVCLYGDGVCCWPNWENHFTVEYGLFKIESLD
jgi:hypothetical protein